MSERRQSGAKPARSPASRGRPVLLRITPPGPGAIEAIAEDDLTGNLVNAIFNRGGPR
jgi:hypothetical protein